jgi:protein O-GlcNAc transferase
MDLQAQLHQAKIHHQRGDLATAQQFYQQILQVEPANIAAHHLLGVLRSQQGRNDEAIALIGKALAISPDNFGALSSYGPLLMAAGRFTKALETFEKALAIQPDSAPILYNYGLALAMLKRFEEALAYYERALLLQPDFVAAWTNHGLALAMLERFGEALFSYDRALLLQPEYATAWINRGFSLAMLKRHEEALASYDRALASHGNDAEANYNKCVTLIDLGRFEKAIESCDNALAIQPSLAAALEMRGLAQSRLNRFEEALASYDRALSLQPNNALIWNRRGEVLFVLKRYDKAFTSCERALALQADLAEAFHIRGRALRKLARFREALESYDRALTLDPGNAAIWNHRGTLLSDMQRYDDAVASYSKAIAIKPDHVEALINRGSIQWSHGQFYSAAIEDLEHALAIEPWHAYARGELLSIKMYGADWTDFDRQKILINEGVREGRLAIRPFAYQSISESPAALLACARIFATLFPPADDLKIHSNRSRAKIRLGYVSADFCEQATAYLTVGLYEMHDKEKFELIAFDNGADDNSPIRKRLKAAFDKIIDISKLSDRAAADRIRAEEVDILINLNGYFGSHRMGVFAERPAPIQLNYLGFPGTLGAPYIDYILADRIVIPVQERRHYVEQVVYLPGCYQANDSKREISEDTPTRAENSLPDKVFVFCNFNQSYKFSPTIFAVWMQILKRVPNSVLWLLEGTPTLRENLSREAEFLGVSRTRLVFAPRIAPAKHLARLTLADLFLDSLPYNAHTTASDALWAGLPIITCRGTTFPGRVGASLLEAAGLPELIAESLKDYEQLAIALATNAARFGALKKILSQNRLKCVLFDTNRFRRHIEAAYTTMWQRWQRGEAPCSFSVEPIS